MRQSRTRIKTSVLIPPTMGQDKPEKEDVNVEVRGEGSFCFKVWIKHCSWYEDESMCFFFGGPKNRGRGCES